MIRFILAILRFASFMVYYLIEFLKANVYVMVDMFTPGSKASPAIVKFPLQSKTSIEITMLSCLISLTPGTLSLAIQANPPVLFVHGIYAPEADVFRSQLAEMETYMLKSLRYPENWPKKEEKK